MWLMTTPSSSHISPLHDQLVRGRHVVISEKAELHLIWIDNRVFIKPLPKFLLSQAFWSHYLCSDNPEDASQQFGCAQAALGYLRTWFYLIRHESDYNIAVEKKLIPTGVSFDRILFLTAELQKVSDEEVSPRYHVGEIRLSRLNFWCRILLFRCNFHKVAWQYSEYFARYYAPILFIFGALSVVLSAMQTGITANQGWGELSRTSAWFSVVTLAFVCLIMVFLILVLVMMLGREIIFALRKKLKAFCGQSRAKEHHIESLMK